MRLKDNTNPFIHVNPPYYRKDGFWEAPTTASLLKC